MQSQPKNSDRLYGARLLNVDFSVNGWMHGRRRRRSTRAALVDRSPTLNQQGKGKGHIRYPWWEMRSVLSIFGESDRITKSRGFHLRTPRPSAKSPQLCAPETKGADARRTKTMCEHSGNSTGACLTRRSINDVIFVPAVHTRQKENVSDQRCARFTSKLAKTALSSGVSLYQSVPQCHRAYVRTCTPHRTPCDFRRVSRFHFHTVRVGVRTSSGTLSSAGMAAA